MEEKDFKYYEFLGDRCIRHLFKEFLGQLDYLYNDGKIDESEKENIRIRILDTGNNLARLFKDQGANYFELNEGLSEVDDLDLIEELEDRGYVVTEE